MEEFSKKKKIKNLGQTTLPFTKNHNSRMDGLQVRDLDLQCDVQL